MFQKLEDVEKRYEELNKMISNPDIISNQKSYPEETTPRGFHHNLMKGVFLNAQPGKKIF